MRAGYLLRGMAMLTCFSVLAVSRPATPSTEQAQQELSRLEREWLGNHNPETLDRILADDFVHVLPFGFLSKADEIENARRHAFNHTGLQYRLEKLRVRIYGLTGVVNGVVATLNAEGTVVQRTRFTNVFVYRSDYWQAVNAQEEPAAPKERVMPHFP
jgi:hypothetical protein